MLFKDLKINERFIWKNWNHTKIDKNTSIADEYECSDYMADNKEVIKIENKIFRLKRKTPNKNDLGKFIRKLRAEKAILLKHMADYLEISCSDLSSIEMGRKAMPEDLMNKAVEFFHKIYSEDSKKL